MRIVKLSDNSLEFLDGLIGWSVEDFDDDNPVQDALRNLKVQIDDADLDAALRRFGEMDPELWIDIAPHFKCDEADAVCAVLQAVGANDASDYLMSEHLASEDNHNAE